MVFIYKCRFYLTVTQYAVVSGSHYALFNPRPNVAD